jgi:hypothetical protein
VVDELRALVQLEHLEAAESGRLRQLDADVGEVRARAEIIAAFFDTAHDEDVRLRDAEDEARADVGRREAELASAEEELARAGNETERTLAEQRLTRARDHLQVASLAAERAAEERAAFELEAAALTRELPRLEERACALTREIPGEAPIVDGDLIDWSSRARAAVFVAASDVDARRERAVLEANELASALLGESTHGSTPEQALARVEAAH